MARCLSTYEELDAEGFSAAARRRLAGRRLFPHTLAFSRADVTQIRAEYAPKMSISGVREKISLRLNRGKLETVGEGGEYILKPAPGQILPRFNADVPANESLTMQIAEQVYGLNTAANACIRLSDGELAYITRRFDRNEDGSRIAQEDFCQLLRRTPKTHGRNYKYDSSYQALGESLKAHVGAYVVEVERLFKRVAFNYFVANGDAHLKNFSIYQVEGFGDYVLTPAYDLLCTKLHVPDESRLALDLFDGDEYPAGVETHGFVTGADLLELAERYGMRQSRAAAFVDELIDKRSQAVALVERSFLSDEAKEQYVAILEDRTRALELR